MPSLSSSERPQKRTKFLSDDEESDAAENPVFKINAEYARRFEHNKQREDRQRLEEKYGKDIAESDEDEESTDESEDDDAEFATADVDAEILETLNAIRSKDPRVYDKDSKFFKSFEAGADTNGAAQSARREKPMYLQDYHRQNLLDGHAGVDEDEEASKAPMSYQQEQDALKRELVGSMHAAVNGGDSDDDDGDLLVAKSKPSRAELVAATARPTVRITEADISTADKDPEKYLSNFMAARAWLPDEGVSSKFQPFESDESDDEARADAFEEAYNMRFENPEAANEKLQSFARDVGKYGVRREDKSARAKARERERERKEAERKERSEDKARLRKMKVEEAEEKIRRIKEAAGLRGQAIDLADWRDVLDDEFDDDKWEREMKARFGEDYYAEHDAGIVSDENDDESKSSKRKPKKPKWDDDIDIQDLVPDFDEEDQPDITLTDDEDGVENEDGGVPLPSSDVDSEPSSEDDSSKPSSKKTKAQRTKAAAEAKRVARRERREIESLVDASLPLTHPALAASSASSKVPVVGFRYRDTSPTTFGLSTRDVLFADDTQLNQYAGLKKLAAFRDADRKARDRKKYSKKQRLRQWRKETFGKGEEPEGGFENVLSSTEGKIDKKRKASGGAEVDGEKKRKKKRKGGKGKAEASTS